MVLSDGVWRRKFGADPSIVGRAILLDRRPYTVVGVMPRSFVFPNRGPILNNTPADLFIPISFTNRELAAFGSMYNLSVVAKLGPGVSAGQADAEVRAVAGTLVRDIYPASFRELGFPTLSGSVVPLRDETVGRVQRLPAPPAAAGARGRAAAGGGRGEPAAPAPHLVLGRCSSKLSSSPRSAVPPAWSRRTGRKP